LLVAILYALVSLLADLMLLCCRPAQARGAELLALRHGVCALRRRVERAAWRPGDRSVLSSLSRCLPRAAWCVLPVRPEALLRWHREPVRRRWGACGRRRGPGRPLPSADVRGLIGRLAAENRTWGYPRSRGELLKLGHGVSATAIRSVLRRSGVPPAPRRARRGASSSARAGALLEGDFFAVEIVRPQPLHVLFFLEVHTRRVCVVGCTAHPTAAWAAQQAGDVGRASNNAGARSTVLVRDRDAKFPPAFDDVFRSEDVRVVGACRGGRVGSGNEGC
jgi:hypothetical protein